jgi:hypothetical protein
LQIAVIGTDQKACFINARQPHCGSQQARLFSLENLRSARTKATGLAEQLGEP